MLAIHDSHRESSLVAGAISVMSVKLQRRRAPKRPSGIVAAAWRGSVKLRGAPIK